MRVTFPHLRQLSGVLERPKLLCFGQDMHKTIQKTFYEYLAQNLTVSAQILAGNPWKSEVRAGAGSGPEARRLPVRHPTCGHLQKN
jgi:hypothetical protein